jgi:hypothetical protein
MKMTRHPEGNLLAGVDLLVDSQITENVPKNCWGRSLFRGNRSHILVNGEGNFSRRLAAMGASS